MTKRALRISHRGGNGDLVSSWSSSGRLHKHERRVTSFTYEEIRDALYLLDNECEAGTCDECRRILTQLNRERAAEAGLSLELTAPLRVPLLQIARVA